MKILVTGGAGFIGSHVCEKLLKRGDSVVCIDDLNDFYNPKNKRDNLQFCLKNPNFILYQEDIRNFNRINEIFQKENIDKIIHLAARAGVRDSFKFPDLYFDVNVNGTKNLLNIAVQKGIKHFIFASSSSVYGTNKKIPFSETDSIDNIESPYAETKKQGEIICKDFSEKHSLKISCLRFFTVYGPRGRPDMAPYKFVNSILKNQPIDIYMDKEDFNNGKMARDFTFVEDIVNGILLALDKPFNFEIFNLGRGQAVKLNEFIKIIENLLNKKAVKRFLGKQKGDVALTYSDISKANRLLNYFPKTDLYEGLKIFIENFKNYKP